MDLLIQEIEFVAGKTGPSLRNRKVDAVYFGGGTPSDLDELDLVRVLATLKANFHIDADTEITVEGRVRGFTVDKVSAWVASGVNRLSIGVQTADTDLRRSLGRLADKNEVRTVLTDLAGSEHLLIVDLMFDLPGQTFDLLLEDIRFLSEETQIDGLDLYQLRVFPGSPLERALDAKRLPALASDMDKQTLHESAKSALKLSGFENFAPRHWRRNELERSIYNQIANAGCDILPFGSGAGGRKSEKGFRITTNLERYTAFVKAGIRAL